MPEGLTIPDTLTALPRWVLWRGVPGTAADGTAKLIKKPFRVVGGPASSTDPATWATYEQVIAAAIPKPGGIGFVFNGDGIIGIDLDKCAVDRMSLEPWAAEIVERFDTYTEWSPSGNGLHLFVRGTLPDCRRARGKVEMYGSGRYFTVTGDALRNVPIAENQAAIDWLADKHLREPSRGIAPNVLQSIETMRSQHRQGELRLTMPDPAADARKVLPLLSDSRAEDYSEWIRVGLAMKDAGLSLDDWLAFSSRCPSKYDRDEAEAKWATFAKSQGKGVAALVGMAQDDAGKPAVSTALGHAAKVAKTEVKPAIVKPLPTLSNLMQGFVAWRETNAGRSTIGLECGMQQIDAALSGWRGLSILAAAPGAGKTTLTLQVANRIVHRNPAAIAVVFSAEMTARDIAGSLLSMSTGLGFRSLAIPSADTLQEGVEHDAAIRKAIDGYREIDGRLVVFDPAEIEEGSDALFAWLRQRIDQAMQAAGASEVFVVIDNLQQFPIRPANGGEWYSDLERDRFAIEMMMRLQHSLQDSYKRAATVVVSETSKAAQDRQDDGLTGVLGSGRIVYKADSVLVMTPAERKIKVGEKDGKAIYKQTRVKHDGMPLVRLNIAKGRLGVERTAVFLAFDYERHALVEVAYEDIAGDD